MSHFEQATDYIKANKSFRAFENECNVPAEKSGQIWSAAALSLQGDGYKEYTVSWTIDIDAPTPEMAAQIAYDMLQDKDNTATCFEVAINNGEPEQDIVMIDVANTAVSA